MFSYLLFDVIMTQHFSSSRRTRQISRFSRPCYWVMFHCICYSMVDFYCPSRYLHVGANFISKFEVEDLLWDFEMTYIGLKIQQLLRQLHYRGSCKISLNISVFFKFFVLRRLVSQLWFWTTLRTLLCASFNSTKEKFYHLWCEHDFYEKFKI